MSLEAYRLGRILGVGTFGRVRVAEHIITKEKVAIKTMNRLSLISQGVYQKTLREIAILLKLKHPHLVRVYEAIIQEEQIHVVMEYVPGGELFDLITTRGRMTEPEARRFFQQLISCLEFCHYNQVAHRDLKPENILLDENRRIKVADFGLSNVMRDGRFLLTPCGSQNYAAPELISGKPYCGSQIDIWSSGVILLASLTGALPFDDSNEAILYRKIKEAKYYMPSYLSLPVKELIRKMLHPNPLERITISEIKNHCWYVSDLPLYLQIMDNSKCDIKKTIDPELFKELTLFKEYGITEANSYEVAENIKKKACKNYTVAYELLQNRKEKKELLKMMSCNFPLYNDKPAYIVDKVQMMFSSEAIKKMREKKTVEPHPGTLKTASTGASIAEISMSDNKEGDTVKLGKWQFGVLLHSYPYELLRKTLECLKEMGFRWRFNAPKYMIRARKVLHGNILVKYELTLYTYSNIEKLLMIDIRKIGRSNVMHFFDFCVQFKEMILSKCNQG